MQHNGISRTLPKACVAHRMYMKHVVRTWRFRTATSSVKPSEARRATGGFTLAETMLALAIVAVLAGMVTMGIPAAFSAYSKVVETSNAQVVLTNATTNLRNELGLASKAWVTGDAIDGAKAVVGYVTAEGNVASIRNSSKGKNESEGLIKVDYYAGSTESSALNLNTMTPKGTNDLVPEASINNSSQGRHALKLSFTGIKYKKGMFIVEGLKVKNSDDAELASVDKYEVKAIMLESVEG